MALDDAAAIVSVLNPTGGLRRRRLGSRSRSTSAPGAHACLTTPSATKVYRTAARARRAGRCASRLAPGARLEWVPDHTIPFPGAAFRQTIDADVAEGARLILVDAFAAGRVARGEAWRFARLESALSDPRRPRAALLHDRFVLARAARRDGLGITEGRPYFATWSSWPTPASTRLPTRCRARRRAADVDVAVAVRPPRRRAVVRCLAPTRPRSSTALQAALGRRARRGARCAAARAPQDAERPRRRSAAPDVSVTLRRVQHVQLSFPGSPVLRLLRAAVAAHPQGRRGSSTSSSTTSRTRAPRRTRIKEVEHQGDQITHEIVRKLNTTFITPIDREDIHALATRLDDVLDYIEAAAERLVVYRIKEPTSAVPGHGGRHREDSRGDGPRHPVPAQHGPRLPRARGGGQPAREHAPTTCCATVWPRSSTSRPIPSR